MFDYIEEYKKYIILFFILLFCFVFLFYSFWKDDMLVKEETKKELSEDETYLSNQTIVPTKVPKKKNTNVVFVDKKDKKQQRKENKRKKEFILKSVLSNKNRYSIQLISSKQIKKNKKNSRYIVLTGSISNEDEKDFLFNLSLKEEEIKDTNILKFKIKDTKNKIQSQCDGYILDTLSVGFSYHMQIEFYGNIANCYISSQTYSKKEDYDTKEIKNIFNKKIKLLDKKYSKDVKIKDISLTQD